MEYAIQDVAQIIGARTKALHDCTISILLTDSRRLSFPETSLFFALATKTNDGHRYVQDLYKLRVRNFVVSKMLPEFEQMEEANFLLVKDVLAALQKLVAYHRKRFQIPVIGITGSNGKTVVKEFLYQLLHNEFDIVRSPRSYNSQIGVPLSVWEKNKMTEKHQQTFADSVNDVPNCFPAAMRAQKIAKGAAKAGMDFASAKDAANRLNEELAEFFESYKRGDKAETEKELGDVLFAAGNVGRKAVCDCEKALKESAERFAKRFTLAEKYALQDGKTVTKLSESEWDGYYQKAKGELNAMRS